MRFENNRFRIIIEKKRQAPEQEEIRKQKKKKNIRYITVFFLLAGIICLAVCGIKYGIGVNVSDTYEDALKLAAGVKEKYGQQGLYPYSYGEPIEDLGRNENIELKLGYDALSLEKVDYWYEVYSVYQNPELTQRVQQARYSWNAQNKILTIEPPNAPINSVEVEGLPLDVANRYSHSKYTLFDQGNGTDWGNLKTLYLAEYYDPHTGEKLEQPIVHIITRKGELEATPHLSYMILEDGRPEFSWTAVEGASDYIVCEATYSKEDGFGARMGVLGTTDGQTWTTAVPVYNSIPRMNQEFRTFQISEDEWKDESTRKLYQDRYEPGKVVQRTDERKELGICVIAVGDEGTSMISNVFFYSEIASNLPYSPAVYTERQNGITKQYEDARELPTYDYVIMCDGIVNRKLIDYQTEKAKILSRRFIDFGEDGEPVGGEDMLCLEIPYRIEGTPFYDSMTVIGYEEEKLEEDLKFLEERQNALVKKSGDRSLMADLDCAMKELPKRGAMQIRKVSDTQIFASCALTEYLVAGMLGGTQTIDISAFPEAKDVDFVEDALLEAYYQNPLILGIQGYRIDRRNMTVRISYDDTARVQAKKQKRIKEKIVQVVSKIIKPRMTDEEKVLAINQYLCDTVVYDEEALLNAQEYDFLSADEKYKDSFTAYGALINGKCVCGGYAGAFKLLADAAGLDSIVVTGVLEGGSFHTWNKVKIEKEWQIVDVTNNDNEELINALLNLPSFAGDRVLVEDKSYLLDQMIGNYEGESEEYEYYHRKKSFFPVDKIAGELAEDLADDGKAVLRTDYALNDEQFNQITETIYEMRGDDIDLYGYYWFGVIYLCEQ